MEPSIDSKFIQVRDCRACSYLPQIVDAFFFALTHIYAIGRRINVWMMAAALLVDWMREKIVPKLIGAAANESCLRARALRYEHPDKRYTVQSAGESVTGTRHRKRVKFQPVVLQGGEFGGGGAGSTWELPPGVVGQVEPLTGFELVQPNESGEMMRYVGGERAEYESLDGRRRYPNFQLEGYKENPTKPGTPLTTGIKETYSTFPREGGIPYALPYNP